MVSQDKIDALVQQLTAPAGPGLPALVDRCCLPPSVEALRRVIEIFKWIVFPGYFDKDEINGTSPYFIGANIDLLATVLRPQIVRALTFSEKPADNADELTAAFIDQLPEIRRRLYTDTLAIVANDPAVDNIGQVILCYPAITAMTHQRVAHALHKAGVPVIPRILTELAHSATGIDIHPAAEIGDYFAIDHGTGVVIGETCVIGHHVTIYQGVTLGAKNFTYDNEGNAVNVPRHPIIGNNVTIYANATILGRITIGDGSTIGGNVWLTASVPPGSRVLPQGAQITIK